MDFKAQIGSFLLQNIKVGYIKCAVPTIEEIESICCSGGVVAALGAYLSFLRILAERNPYFYFLSVKTYQLLYVSSYPITIFPPAKLSY